MHAIIDRQHLAFLAANDSVDALVSLCAVEFPDIHVAVVPCGVSSVFRDWTDLELRLLYRNTTGEVSFRPSVELMQVLAEISTRLPARELRPLEVLKVEQSIPSGTKEPFTYVPGFNKAMPSTTLFGTQRTPLPVPKSESEASIAKAGGFAAPVRVCVPLPVQGNTTPGPRNAAPRNGTTKQIIHSVADEYWVKAGSPMDIPSLLKIRKELMDVLESEYNVKRTSSSNELGVWQKSKLDPK